MAPKIHFPLASQGKASTTSEAKTTSCTIYCDGWYVFMSATGGQKTLLTDTSRTLLALVVSL